MSGSLLDKVAVVTGGASGIGAAMVARFLAEGAKVVAADVAEHSGDALRREVADRGQSERFEFVAADVRDEKQVERSVKATIDRFGRLDIMCNNAGLTGPTGHLTELAAADWDRLFAVVCRGVFLGIKHAALNMPAGGSIINTGSTAGLVGGMTFAYSAAKAAVINMTKGAAVQLAPDRIRVNCICPGAIVTPMLLRGRDPQLLSESLADGSVQPWPRAGQPSDVAGAAVFLAGDDSAFITGHALVVDGGMLSDARLGYPRAEAY